MNNVYLLEKLAPVGVAAFGAISFISIATIPAQAQTLSGGLTWSNETTKFIQDFTILNGLIDPNDLAGSLSAVNTALSDAGSFDITFNPDPPATARVGSASGDFAPSFPDTGINYDVDPSTVSFNYVVDSASLTPSGDSINFEYLLGDELDFNFDVVPDVLVEFSEGDEFLGVLELDSTNGNVLGVAFEEETLGGTVTIGTETQAAFSQALVFEDIVGTDLGEYAASVSVQHESVPEPATILGVLAVGSLGLGLKRKKQA